MSKQHRLFTSLAIGFMVLSMVLTIPGSARADDPSKIQWGTPQEILARLAADKYELPKGWKEAIGDTKEIVVYNYGPLLPSDPATKANADIFTELTGVKVKFLELLATQMIQKETAMLVAQSAAADIVVTLESKTLDFLKAGWYMPLPELWASDEIWAQYPPAYRAVSEYQGVGFGAPNISKAYMINYRKSLFKAADVHKAPETWDEWIAAAKKLTKDSNGDGIVDQWGLIIGLKDALGYRMIANLLFGAGGKFVYDGKVKVDTPEMAQVFQFLVDLRNKHKVVPLEVNNIDYLNLVDRFKRGNIAMAMFGFELPSQLGFPEDMGQALLPAPTRAGLGTTSIDYEVIGVNPYSKNKAASMIYIDLKRSKQAQINELVIEKNLSSWLPAYDDPAIIELVPAAAVLRKALEKADLQVYPEIAETSAILVKELSDALLEKKTVAQALADAQSQVDLVKK
jgi:ABC-type glycerol-3-phosphate transport system substrate-binding protein